MDVEAALRKMSRVMADEGIQKDLDGRKFHQRPAVRRVKDKEDSEMRFQKRKLKRTMNFIMSRRARGF
ncbi:hypothetical protein CYMTET_42921 [Cymbomonas tetramitiformis]|uniref:30S ribosomal protein S21 n=1 Tax=Cymbomonas tetramitiformis TaxID=36881 RepID=A0AAE0EWN9_9CHLO|nr:hypothetical protein CYMTET_46913 [Cymbomonas tetramitiformis]KAK3247586.1 hypothetical protein CYMTET_42921 [Cymbomonas tetramitiformis]